MNSVRQAWSCGESRRAEISQDQGEPETYLCECGVIGGRYGLTAKSGKKASRHGCIVVLFRGQAASSIAVAPGSMHTNIGRCREVADHKKNTELSDKSTEHGSSDAGRSRDFSESCLMSVLRLQ